MRMALFALFLIAWGFSATLSSCYSINGGSYVISTSLLGKGSCLNITGEGTLDLNGKTVSAETPLEIRDANFTIINGELEGIVVIYNSSVALKDVEILGGVVSNSSDVQFVGSVEGGETPLRFYSSNASLVLNITRASGMFLEAEDSNISVMHSVFSNLLDATAALKLTRTNLSLSDVAIYNLFSQQRLFLASCLNSTLDVDFLSSPTLYLNGTLCDVLRLDRVFSDDSFLVLENSSKNITGDYSLVLLYSSNATLSGSFGYVKAMDSKINVSSSEISSELLAIRSEIRVFNAKFFPFGKLELINSSATVVNSLFCSPSPYYVYDFSSNISFSKNYVSGVAGLFSSGALLDLNDDFIGDAGEAYPLGKGLNGWISDDYDPKPIIAKDVSCLLAPVRGRAQLSMNVSYDCTTKQISVSANFLNLPVTFDVFVTKTAPPYETHTFSSFSNADIEINSTGTYKVTVSSPGVLPSTVFLNTYECGEEPKEERITEARVYVKGPLSANEEHELVVKLPTGNPASFLPILVRTPYGSEISLQTGTDGTARFIPPSPGKYELISPGITLLGDVSIDIKEAVRLYYASTLLNLTQRSQVIISSKPNPVPFNLTVYKGDSVVFNGTVNYSLATVLDEGHYNITAVSTKKMSGISILVPSNASSDFIITLNDVVALLLMLLVLGLPMVLVKRPRYKATATINEDFVVLAIKDYYNLPAKGVLVKVFRDGEKVAEGKTDDAGIFAFRMKRKGTYVVFAGGTKVSGGVIRKE